MRKRKTLFIVNILTSLALVGFIWPANVNAEGGGQNCIGCSEGYHCMQTVECDENCTVQYAICQTGGEWKCTKCPGGATGECQVDWPCVLIE